MASKMNPYYLKFATQNPYWNGISATKGFDDLINNETYSSGLSQINLII